MALARPGISESQSHLKPGQSRGFQAKPGQKNTTKEKPVVATGDNDAGDVEMEEGWDSIIDDF